MLLRNTTKKIQICTHLIFLGPVDGFPVSSVKTASVCPSLPVDLGLDLNHQSLIFHFFSSVCFYFVFIFSVCGVTERMRRIHRHRIESEFFKRKWRHSFLTKPLTPDDSSSLLDFDFSPPPLLSIEHRQWWLIWGGWKLHYLYNDRKIWIKANYLEN